MDCLLFSAGANHRDMLISASASCSRNLTRRPIMIDKAELCEKIRKMYPDIGECGIDVKVDYDEEQKTWVVYLNKDKHELKTFLEDDDAEKCMIGKKCVGLGIEIAQLRANIERMPKDR
jgi:hypothetical protein